MRAAHGHLREHVGARVVNLAQHSSKSVEHYTPVDVVERARRTLGGIDLDPASCALANEVVRATRWFGDGEVGGQGNLLHTVEPRGGLFREWHGRVFLNPPGGKLHKDTLEPVEAGPGLSAAAVWWAKLWSEWDAGHVEAAIFVCFSLAVFRTGQVEGVRPPQAFPFCVLEDRLDYDKPDENGRRVASKGAPADSAIVLLPRRGLGYDGAMVDRFVAEFSPLGYVRI